MQTTECKLSIGRKNHSHIMRKINIKINQKKCNLSSPVNTQHIQRNGQNTITVTEKPNTFA